MNPNLFCAVLLCGSSALNAAEPPLPHFRMVEIDPRIDIGYGITVADVDGDGKPDIIVGNKLGTFVFIQQGDSETKK